MGCGKSTIGRILKEKIGYQLVDTDLIIEQQQGMPIADIFEKQGEQSFRDMETKLLQDLSEQHCHEHIISTGGGIVTRPENSNLLRQLGFVVWLTCSSEDILTRTSRNNNRPLLQGDNPMKTITRLLEERTPMYESAAHLKINTSDLQFDEVVCGVLESARYHYGSMQ